MKFFTLSRFIAAIVIISNLVAGLASCSGNKEGEQTTAGQTTAAQTTVATTADTTDDTDIAKDSGWTKDYR